MTGEGHDYSQWDGDMEPGANLMARIEGLAHEQVLAEKRIVNLEAQLTEAKAAYRNIRERSLPELLDESQLGESTLVTPGGFEIKLGDAIRGSIPKGKEQPAFDWLEDHDNGGLIKRTITIDFGKGQEKWADKFERDCAQRKKPLNLKRKMGVNTQTLCAFIKSALEDGVEIPMKTFGVYRQRFAKVTTKIKS